MRWLIGRGRKRPRAGEDVLGINRRNLDYVYRLNARERFRLVDDKITAKQILAEHGLPVPKSLAEIDRREQIPGCIERLRKAGRFIVKPACGFGGSGVVAFDGAQSDPARSDEEWDDLAFHMAAILSGMFALDSVFDRVLVEEYVSEDPRLSTIHGGQGVSDVRVIVSESKPVMTMLRLPCSESAPTANLHRGGIGVGIDLERGRTTFGVHHDRKIDVHPDTGVSLGGIEIPRWREVLGVTTPINEAFGLGYLGADIVLDREQGPIVLEVNARPGLAIQLANRRGLLGALGARRAPV